MKINFQLIAAFHSCTRRQVCDERVVGWVSWKAGAMDSCVQRRVKRALWEAVMVGWTLDGGWWRWSSDGRVLV